MITDSYVVWEPETRQTRDLKYTIHYFISIMIILMPTLFIYEFSIYRWISKTVYKQNSIQRPKIVPLENPHHDHALIVSLIISVFTIVMIIVILFELIFMFSTFHANDYKKFVFYPWRAK